MTNQTVFIQQIINALHSAGIAYMISGSMASAFYGTPRATNDTDIVIDPVGQQLEIFLQSLNPACYVSREAVMEALKGRTMFNVIDIENGWKVDFILCKSRQFSRQEFARRRTVQFMGLNLSLLSPEDSILSKLEWTKSRQSRMQQEDVLGVLISQRNTLDFDYLRRWAKELNVIDLLEQCIIQAQEK